MELAAFNSRVEYLPQYFRGDFLYLVSPGKQGVSLAAGWLDLLGVGDYPLQLEALHI